MMTDEMTDDEVRQQVERTDCFIEQLRDAITATVVDPASLCADAQRRGLRRIATTLDAVPYVTFCNLANLNAAMRGGLLEIIEVHLMRVGAGPTLDFADAAAFLAGFRPMIDMALARRLN
jgi:hypothetical protein